MDFHYMLKIDFHLTIPYYVLLTYYSKFKIIMASSELLSSNPLEFGCIVNNAKIC